MHNTFIALCFLSQNSFEVIRDWFWAKLCFSLNTSVGLLMCLGWITLAYPWNKMVLSAGRLQFCKFNKRSIYICEVVFDIHSLLTHSLCNQNRHTFSKHNKENVQPHICLASNELSSFLITTLKKSDVMTLGENVIIPAINYVCCQPYFLPFQPLCGFSASLYIYIKQIHILISLYQYLM